MAFELINTDNVTDAGALELDGARSVSTAAVGGTTYLFVASPFDDGVSVFAVGTDGTLTNAYNVTDLADLELDGATSVASAEIGGITYLFVTGQSDDGVSVFSVAEDGTLTNVDNVTDAGALELDGAHSVATATFGATTYLFVAGFGDDGVSVFSVGANGALAPVVNIDDTDDISYELAGAYSVTTAVVNSLTYLFVAGFDDDGVSVFRVSPDGTLTNVDNVTDGGGLELQGAIGTTTAVVGGTTYLFVAGTFDNGVSVFSVANDGTLTNVDNVTDAGALELKGATSVTTQVVDGITYLFVA
ncbi:MAG: hemolysin-type calcium-binding protein, partial [Hyphomicrobiales bacterium]|nr:hemolysin-type calcium-binding protein [Hyphomicrobiales bacterium]